MFRSLCFLVSVCLSVSHNHEAPPPKKRTSGEGSSLLLRRAPKLQLRHCTDAIYRVLYERGVHYDMHTN